MRLPGPLKRAIKFRLYDPRTTLLVPAGQSVYDPAVFDRYDPSTQRVVSLDDDGFWAIGFDEMVGPAQRVASAEGGVESDRYSLVLSLLTEGTGTCLDACTIAPLAEVRERVEQLGYRYLPIDIAGDGEEVAREDVTDLSYETDSIARIISLDTLEHVVDYRAALAEFQRVLEPGGILFLHVPAYFFDRETSAPLDPSHDPWGHVRYFSGRELVESIGAAGLVLLRAQLHLDYGAMLCVAAKSSAAAHSPAD
jgi:SAM-dependent methyltransferase